MSRLITDSQGKIELTELVLLAFIIAISTLISAAVGPDIRSAYTERDSLLLLFYVFIVFGMALLPLLIVYLIGLRPRKKKKWLTKKSISQK